MGRDASGWMGTIYVSIHAPAWGATAMAVADIIKKLGFNPRARMGRDRAMRHYVSVQRFNPRARMGRDSAADRHIA